VPPETSRRYPRAVDTYQIYDETDHQVNDDGECQQGRDLIVEFRYTDG
jgi:hypothetical protein